MKYTSKVRSKNKPRDLDIKSINEGPLNLENLKITIPEIHNGDDTPLLSKHHLVQQEIPLNDTINNIPSFKNVENDIENAVKTEESKIKKTEIVLDSSDNAIV